MSLIEKNKVDVNRWELSIHVEAEALEKAVEKAYRKNIGKINVPGFRKGKAPRKMVEKMYGEGFFFEDAINELYPTALREAIEEAGLEVVAPAEVEAKEVSLEKGFDFVAKCVVKPEVSVKDYKGIAVTKEKKEVTDEDVANRLKAMQDRGARLVDAEGRASQKGDTLTFDFDGYLDGVAFDGGKAEKFSLELGSGQFIPGFEEQLEGRNIGDEFDVHVTFPENYHAEELKGKPVVFKCKVHEIKSKELPELDDEFAKDVSDKDTLDELKADNVLQERLKSLPNVEVFVSSQTTEVIGNGDKLTALRIKDRKTEEERLVELDGVFVQIGLSANSSVFRDIVETNRPGEIVIDAHCRTNVTGIYAAGDVSTVPYKQIIISMGEGAKAALSAFDDRVRGII